MSLVLNIEALEVAALVNAVRTILVNAEIISTEDFNTVLESERQEILDLVKAEQENDKKIAAAISLIAENIHSQFPSC